jgi:hypothetical protein
MREQAPPATPTKCRSRLKGQVQKRGARLLLISPIKEIVALGHSFPFIAGSRKAYLNFGLKDLRPHPISAVAEIGI